MNIACEKCDPLKTPRCVYLGTVGCPKFAETAAKSIDKILNSAAFINQHAEGISKEARGRIGKIYSDGKSTEEVLKALMGEPDVNP